MCLRIHIYIYIARERERERETDIMYELVDPFVSGLRPWSLAGGHDTLCIVYSKGQKVVPAEGDV